MAQKIEFIRASSLTSLAEDYNAFVEGFADDPRFILTPIGFATDADDYVLAVRVEATHKRTFIDPPPESDTNEG